jgi:phosphoribosylformylglycinamidine synthase
VSSINYQGSVLAEIDENAILADCETAWVLVGRTLEKKVFRIVCPAEPVETPLEELRRAYESPLAKVYPFISGFSSAPAASPAPLQDEFEIKNTSLSRYGTPLVLLPVFPGTNCEWDMERAFREAGAETRLNRNREDINKSIEELTAAFAEAQIIAFSGGFSAGGEPAASSTFFASLIRHALIAAAITEFLEKRDGLILGIGSGFQALLKTGLVPYGRIIPLRNSRDDRPTLAVNAIGRHVSRMIRTRVMPNNSPWLNLEKPGDIHIIPFSHDAGRMVISAREAETLFAAGQVPCCYADAEGNPAIAEPDNPNGSAFGIEALTSPNGRVLGKMSHSERYGEFVHINSSGNKRQRIFEAGVGYFR